MSLGWQEVLLLVVLGVVMFGPERLPELARKAARVIYFVRNVANDARKDLRAGLGPEFEDFDFNDLNPKKFVQKHLQEPLEPVKSAVTAEIGAVSDTMKGSVDDLNSSVDSVKSDLASASDAAADAIRPEDRIQALWVPFDTEAT